MEFIFGFFFKTTIIFLGGGLVSLFAFWIARESSAIGKLLYVTLNSDSDSLKISKKKKTILKSALYEILISSGKTLKLFSSQKGIKIF